MDTCAKCGAGLGVGRFCLNCGHPIGAPVSPDEQLVWARAPATEPRPADPQPAAPPVPDPDPVADPVADRVEDGGPALDEGDWLLDGPDDLDDPDDAPARLHWAAWLAGAAALVLVSYLALTWLAGDDDPGDAAGPTGGASSSPAPTSAPEDSEDPEGADGGDGAEGGGVTMPEGRPVDVARGATVTVPQTAPPTTDLDGNLVAYVASQLVDGEPTTAWRMAGDGTGAEIRLVLRQPSVIDRVGLVNGYAKRVGTVDWYPNNRRVLAVRWTFDDGTSVEQTFAERPQLQRLKIDPVRTSAVTLTLLQVTPPGAGPLGRDYTTISSVVLSGRPAG